MNATSWTIVISASLSLFGAYLLSISEMDKVPLGKATRSLLILTADRMGDGSRIKERLTALHGRKSYTDFRVDQLLSATIAGSTFFVLTLLVSGSFLLSMILGIGSGAVICLVIDRQLCHQIIQQRKRLEEEFPAIVEMMSLSLSAGETPAQAIFRISERASGHLAHQFRTTVEEIRSGKPFHLALDEMGRRIDSLIIRRFIDAMVVAVVRGAPLVDVLQRHAVESRSAQKNLVMEKAGKAEISMMIPIVFLILPISILFALWPSLSTMALFST